jgi:carotenoid cleavage dioxygenase
LSRQYLRNPGTINKVDIVWLETTACYLSHTVNAWDNADGSVSLYACRLDSFDLADINEGSLQPSCLYEFRLDPKKGTAYQEPVLSIDKQTDFPRIDDRMIGRKNQFAYFVGSNGLLNNCISGSNILKVDLQSGKVTGEVDFGDNALVGESVFAPRNASNGTSKEDFGYLLTFVIDSLKKESYVAVIDAATMTIKTKLKIPTRVPFGFHGLWLQEQMIEHHQV